MDRIKTYMDQLIEKSTPDYPAWNIEVKKQGRKAKWNYIDGCMIKAILSMYQITEDKKYLAFSDDYISHFLEEDGTIKGLNPQQYNIDNINEGKVLFDLYELTGKKIYKNAIDFLYQILMEHPRTKSGNFWHKLIYPNQVWLDGLYMAQPFYMAYETKFNKLNKYRDIFMQFQTVHDKMRDEKTGLSYHGYDESKEMFWCDPETGLSKNFWSRSMGWYAMALVDTIEQMDEQMFYEYRALMARFKDTINALIQFQDESSGMWYQVIDKGHLDGNYLETSGSAMISYAIMKGVNLEILPERYWQYGYKAFKGIEKQYLEVNDEGELELGGICLVAGLGGKDKRDGTYDYYISEPVVQNDAKGVAPFLLAYTELFRKEQVGHE